MYVNIAVVITIGQAGKMDVHIKLLECAQVQRCAY